MPMAQLLPFTRVTPMDSEANLELDVPILRNSKEQMSLNINGTKSGSNHPEHRQDITPLIERRCSLSQW